MMISISAVKEYQKIFKQKFGAEITTGQAAREGENLLRLFQIVYQPIPIQIEMKKYETNKT